MMRLALVLVCCVVAHAEYASSYRRIPADLIDSETGTGTDTSSSPYGACQLCPEGYFYLQSANATDCNCPVGQGCSNDKTEEIVNCEPCAKGQFSNVTGAMNCSLCAPGSFATGGAANCTPCDPGQYASKPGLPACKNCAAGNFASDYGATTCTACLPGTFAATTGGQTCTECPAGTYASAGASTLCLNCGVGFYSSAEGATTIETCMACPAGSYCPSAATGQPTPCPANSYCVSQASQAQPCPTLFGNNGSASKCSPTAVFYVLVAGIALLTLAACIVCLRNRAGLAALCCNKAPREDFRRIPEPKSGPVYGGY